MGNGDLISPDPLGAEAVPGPAAEGRRNQEVAERLRDRADALESRDDNPFRVRAYRKAAFRIEGHPEDIENLARHGRLREIPGIGKDLAQRILEILNPGGSLPSSDVETEPSTEPFVETIRRATGLNATWARHLYHSLHIRTVYDLEQIVRSHLLRTLPGADLPPVHEMLDRLRSLPDPSLGS